MIATPWEATLAANESIANADPGATISPTHFALARTFASLLPPAPTSDASALPPVRLGREGGPTRDDNADIVLLRELGQGGMGCVHLARQTVFGRTVAVKRVRPDRMCDAAVLALLAEARLSSALDHPNIVPVHLLGRSESGEPVLVMKRVQGIAWRELVLADGPEAARGDALVRHLEILRQVCNAAEFAHRQGVIHRDIKLENVMVGELGEVYLLDWGVAMRVGAPPSTDLAGTPAHMAPEMLPGEGPVTTRTDVYLLGAALYELLTGKTRHEGSAIWAVLGSVMRSDPVTFDAAVPEELAAIVHRATARLPEDRFESALAFGEAVGEFLRHRGSLELSLEAERLLATLRAELARTPDDALRAQVRRTAQECAFGFRQALRAWGDNAHAQRGLGACLEATLAFELAERNAPGAELLLAELNDPDPAHTRALAELKRALAEEALAPAKLVRIERDNDVFLDGTSGGSSPAVVSGLLAAVSIVLSLLGVRLSLVGYVVWCSVVCALVVVTLHAQGHALVFNRASARRTLGTVMVCPFNLAVALLAWTQATPVLQAVYTAFLGQAMMAAVVGITVTRVVLIGVPLYLLGLAVVVVWPRDALFTLGVLTALQAVANRAEAYVVDRTTSRSLVEAGPVGASQGP